MTFLFFLFYFFIISAPTSPCGSVTEGYLESLLSHLRMEQITTVSHLFSLMGTGGGYPAFESLCLFIQQLGKYPQPFCIRAHF